MAHILILAAGQGKRMQSELPKVLHPILMRPMLHHILDVALQLPHVSISLVVGHGEEQVREACKGYSNLQFFRQNEQNGTGHAVMSAQDFLKNQKGSVLILSGDVVLLKRESLASLIQLQHKEKAHCVFLTTYLDNPTGYGRIIRSSSERILGIQEELDCSNKEQKIKEINAGIYSFEIQALLSALRKISNRNEQGEFYLTDVISVLVKEKKKVLGLELQDASETVGINDRVALASAEKILQQRVNERYMQNGVSLHLPETILIDPHCEIESDVTIETGCVLTDTTIKRGTVIESNCRISDSSIAEGAHIKQGSYIEKSQIGPQTQVGPYARLRPETILERGVKIGSFVETKKALFKEGSKASHLSYIGDAEIGKNVNLGCGFITCNYDGKTKSVTVIEDDVFVGSDSQTVAPVRIGRGSYVASGTTVTDDVPQDSLVISRGKQVTKPGYAKKY